MGQVVAITGAGRGIGLATARRFAETGSRLALNYRESRRSLPEVAATAKLRGGDALVVQGDVGERVEAEQFIAAAENAFGRIDVLVTNAGILYSEATDQSAPEHWQATMRTNLDGTWWCIRAALPGMLKRKSGRIITVSSELGLIGFPTYAAYCASKGAIIALTKALAKEYAPRGILVNSVAPGPIETDMLIKDTIEYNDATREQIPLKRFGKPDEVARVIEFLAGPGGDYMVGQVISPNGGTAI
ncbi:MAG: 3-oxoacyl-ACP reductase FabG [Chloroflexota bacterium]|nr:3-oxoacyl-ACP reductase FabG [Chloroflexota bacterium]